MLVNVFEYSLFDKSSGITDWYIHILPVPVKFGKRFSCIGNNLPSEVLPAICNIELVELHGSFARILPLAIFSGIELYNGIMSFDEIVIG